MQNPTQAYEDIVPSDLNRLYPIELTEPMSKCSDDMWAGKELAMGLAPLKAIVSYKDNVVHIWEEKQLKEKKSMAQESGCKQEHQTVKIFVSTHMKHTW